MSFFGKEFKKVKIDNGPEFFENLNLSEKVISLLCQTGPVATFTKNPDGTLQNVVRAGGNVVLDQEIVLDKEVDFTAPDGIVTKAFYTLQGDQLNSYIKFPNGTTLHMDRTFDDKGMKKELYVDGSISRATVHFDAL